MKKSFDEVFIDSTKYCTKIKTSDYCETGLFAIIDQGQNQIAGYTDSYEGLFEDVPAVIFGDHTRIIKYVNEPFFIGADGVKVLKSKIQDANYKYLYYALKNIDIPNTGYNRHFKWLKESEINYPSFDRQQEIVDALDKVTEIIDNRKQQLQQLDELVKARFVEMFGDPDANPYGWRRVTVQQAISEKFIDKPLDGNHGGKHPKTSDYVPSGIPFLMANNLVDGLVDLENCAFISRNQADSLDKGFAKDGDVLITHKGTIGRTAILRCSYPYVMLTPQVTYYRPITGIIPEYLKAYFDTDYFQGIIENIASVGSTRAYIGITAQQELPLVVPPIELQKQFAIFVEQVDKSKIAVQKALDEVQTLFDSLMQEYFG